VVAACAECHGTCPYDLCKCSTFTCQTWMHASCKVRQCLHYLLELDCGNPDAGHVDWQCTACTIVSPPTPTCARATGSPRGRTDFCGHDFCEFEPCSASEPSLTRVCAPFPFVHPPRLLTKFKMRRMPRMWPQVNSITGILHWLSQHSFSDPRIKRSTATVKVMHERNSNPADDVTIDGGVKSTSVTSTGPIPTVGDTVRHSHRAAPCNLQSGFDMLASTAPGLRACVVTGLECPNMPSGSLACSPTL
jgi:hypothetical protein